MDSSCTLHMCPRKDYFESLNLKEGGVVLLGNNKPCKVQGMGSIRLKMFSASQNQHDKTRLWRVSEKVLPELAKQNLLNGDKMEKLEFCDHCILGKARRVSLEIHLHTISKPFEHDHSDL
ncbi:putative mitochondrial protein, partial [Mucuna pruriens]